MHVAIIGCGTIGQSWACLLAAHGHETALFDAAPGEAQKAMARMRDTLGLMQRAGLTQDSAAAISLVTVHETLESAVSQADYVQESIVEDVSAKRALFEAMGELAPASALLCSSTSAIPGSLFCENVVGRERCLIAHPANPPHLLPVIEVVRTPWTSEEALEHAQTFLTQAGMVPVVLNREVPGFIMNRLQTAVVCEAISLVADGVVSPQGIDDVMRFSLGLRWAMMGPFETMDLNAPLGFGDYAQKFGASYQAMAQTLNVARPWPDEAIEAIAETRRAALPLDGIQARQEWRDEMLINIRAVIEGNVSILK